MIRAGLVLAVVLTGAAASAWAQNKGAITPAPLKKPPASLVAKRPATPAARPHPTLASTNPTAKIPLPRPRPSSTAPTATPAATPGTPKNLVAMLHMPAKVLFGGKAKPADIATRSIGSYAKGCLAGAIALPISGKTWQVMRLSRNRNWGHPVLIKFLEHLAEKAHKLGWPGLLVGDISQPRGGPMLTGHASHQIGLDADIWLTQMPDHVLSRQERETMEPYDVVAPSRIDVDPKVWTPAHVALIKAAAEDPHVERIFVNAAIKKALCRDAGTDRAWLAKVRPWWKHDHHFHVRIKCPAGNAGCENQPPPPPGDGCAPSNFTFWFSPGVIHPQPAPKPTTPAKPRPGISLAALPADCRKVLVAP